MVTPLPQNASFREIVPPECAFSYGTGCRMRFSVECAFPQLGKRRPTSRKSALCVDSLTQKRILGPTLTQKRILDSTPHAEAHSGGSEDPRVHLSVRASYRMRFSVRPGLQNALFRRVRFSSSGQTSSCLTQNRILRRRPHAKPHSAQTSSRKTALWRFRRPQSAPFREDSTQNRMRFSQCLVLCDFLEHLSYKYEYIGVC